VQVVFVDANVLYIRVFRDYLLYAADQELISVIWSKAVLDEAIRNLIDNIPTFDENAADRLRTALSKTFPDSEIEPDSDCYFRLAEFSLPDEDDRHVLAAAIAAEATVLCTSNVRDFPEAITSIFGIRVLTPDALLCSLLENDLMQMLVVHKSVVSNLADANDKTTVAALKAVGASGSASLIAASLGI
jgi:hypothetical protein